MLKPTNWKIANRQDRMINPFPSNWPGLCRTYRVQTQDKERRKSTYMYFVICLQLKQSCPLWVAAINQTAAQEFIKHLKWFITSKGHPRKIYEYNKRTFRWRSLVDKRGGKTSFIHPLLAREEYLCASKVKSSFTCPTSQTNSVKVNSNRNLVCLTKKFMLSPESKSSYPGCQKFYQGKKLFSAYRGTYSRWRRRISIPELIIAPLACKNSDWY